jgi:hypothetical protein
MRAPAVVCLVSWQCSDAHGALEYQSSRAVLLRWRGCAQRHQHGTCTAGSHHQRHLQRRPGQRDHPAALAVRKGGLAGLRSTSPPRRKVGLKPRET